MLSGVPLHVETFICGPMPNNLYLLRDDASQLMVVIDPSIHSEEARDVVRAAEAEGFALAAIWNTHGHFDHVYDNALWKQAWNVPLSMHTADRFLIEHLREQSIFLGFEPPTVVWPDAEFQDGQILELGQHRIEVLCLPGHSPGSVAFYCADEHWCIVGDVLFHNSIGRTDLPGCSAAELNRSLQRLAQLPPDTRILPGHGAETTLGHELLNNPYLQFLRA
jgi:hydroxyacylglutathione hydrolase